MLGAAGTDESRVDASHPSITVYTKTHTEISTRKSTTTADSGLRDE